MDQHEIDYIPSGDSFGNEEHPDSDEAFLRRGCMRLLTMIVTIILATGIGILLTIVL